MSYGEYDDEEDLEIDELEDFDEEYYEDLDEDDPLEDCHYDPRSKVCGKAGSEECDFECPLGRSL